MTQRKYQKYVVADGDYNDVETTDYKEALKAYKVAALPKALFGVVAEEGNDNFIPIFSKL